MYNVSQTYDESDKYVYTKKSTKIRSLYIIGIRVNSNDEMKRCGGEMKVATSSFILAYSHGLCLTPHWCLNVAHEEHE